MAKKSCKGNLTKALAELQVSENRYKELIEISSDVVWETDAQLRLTYSSPKTREVLGFEPKEVLGKRPTSFLSTEEVHLVRSIADKMAPFYKVITVNHHKNGRKVILESSGQPYYDKKGKFAGYRGVHRDVTKRTQAEDILRATEAKLREQNISLEMKNIALAEVMKQFEAEKNRLTEHIAVNVRELIMPIFQKIKMHGYSSKYLDLLQKTIEKMTSSLGYRITKQDLKLSPKEIEICNMIQSGLSNKEIASLLKISRQTVEKHRKNIRKKVGLVHKNENLTSYLQQL
ncbi:MAG: PAS domain S-box protein [bacterium]|jgi:PAS domain S-box-containing protein|nr:PAS domain S-box protein [bacterium]